MIYDSAPEGKAENVNFILDTAVLIFARKDAPTRRDPSFMNADSGEIGHSFRFHIGQSFR